MARGHSNNIPMAIDISIQFLRDDMARDDLCWNRWTYLE